MIAKMKKLTFLIYHKEYDSFLKDIQELGVVHIEEKQSGTAENIELQTNIKNMAHYKETIDMLERLNVTPLASEEVSVENGQVALSKIDSMLEDKAQLQQQLTACMKDLAQVEPWGDFSQSTLDHLAEAGYELRFYICPVRNFRQEWMDTYELVKIHEDASKVQFVIVCHVGDDVVLDIEPARLPEHSLAELQEQRKQIELNLNKIEANLEHMAETEIPSLDLAMRHVQTEVEFSKVVLNTEKVSDQKLMLLEGWVPEESEKAVETLLDKSGVYYEIRKALPEDNAPIKLKNNWFTRMYEVLTKMYGMPDYGEFDPTPLIAPFFTLFFAFCMGDAGYGLVLILLGFILKKKLGPSMAGMMNLVITLGAATTVLGAVFGTFFGVELTNLKLPECISQYMITGKVSGTNYDKQMVLSLIIGVIHLCLAMLVKALCSTARYGFKESLSAWGWFVLVVGFICAGGLNFFNLISADVTKWAFIGIGGVAAIGIYLFNDLHRNVFVNIGAGLWDTYSMASGLMGDFLSYIRLYALGLAGAQLGLVFNDLAFMAFDSMPVYIGWLVCGFILIFGHTLNIAMSCLSAFVHPLRLTFVEYFKNSGYEGRGKAYSPFSIKDK